MIEVRRLGPGDDDVLRRLALDAEAFGDAACAPLGEADAYASIGAREPEPRVVELDFDLAALPR